MSESAGAVANAPIPQRIKRAILAVEPDATILLYGSRARGDARPDSDWDVLVLVDGSPAGARISAVSDAIAPLALDDDVDVSVTIRSRDSWNDPHRRRDLFQINVERDAVPLTPYAPAQPPATEEEMAEARERTVEHWLRQAHRAISDAELLAANERWERCVSTLYYAAFYAVTAYLLRQGLRYSRHTGVKQALHQHLARPGLISPDLVDLYEGLFKQRRYADYDPLAEFTAEEVVLLLHDTRRFVAIIERLLEVPPEA